MVASAVVIRPRLLVGGELRDAQESYPVIDPATEQEIARAPDASDTDLDEAIAAARQAFDGTSWASDPAFRARCLRQLKSALDEDFAALQEITIAEAGVPVMWTDGPQLRIPIDGLDFIADLLDSYPWHQDLGEAKPMGIPTRRRVYREPAGVVAAITPWNFPNQITLAKLGSALAAGCTVVLKPAPDTPWTGAELGRVIAEQTDIPAGVVNVVTSSRPKAGRQLTADPRVDLVSFTGSTATGRDVMASAAATTKKVFLELGGKSAALVLDDYDLGAAAALTAFSVCIHAGQGCALTTRLIVPRSRYDEAVEHAAATMRRVKVGDPRDPGTVCGPVISARQRARIESYLGSAAGDGGRFACGGGQVPGPGFWIEPTVIAGLTNDARAAREEIFGPVLVVLAHDGDDHAVAIANDSPYGLSGAVFGTDRPRARAVAARLRTGTVGINGGVWFSPDVPFGGYKQSGIGREMGVPGFEEYLQIKSVAEPAGD
ncbi:MAG TPA: aldehyde dehydrogenase [Streptosporangiaceae bacterium]|nr:aldehyde dehydrogenase [Streptosporangiaceae bacterium]